jgi:hypothetical protein
VGSGPGSLSGWLSVGKPGPTTGKLPGNRLPFALLRRVACELHEVCWIQEWKHEYPRSRPLCGNVVAKDLAISRIGTTADGIS